jgi:hypothetical protein
VVVPAPRQALDVLGSIFGADRVQLFGDRLHVQTDRVERQTDVRASLDRAGLGPAGVRQVMPSLEDVFIEFMKS